MNHVHEHVFVEYCCRFLNMSTVFVKLQGVKSYKEDGFSLSSGDFPTLGSEKEKSVMNMKSQGC